MSLHKLLYYVKGWHLLMTGESPFPEKIVKSNNGVRIQELFSWADEVEKNMKERESAETSEKHYIMREQDILLNSEISHATFSLPTATKNGIKEVINSYGAKSSHYLKEHTSKEWCVRECEIGETIEDDAIKQRFNEVAVAETLYGKVILDGKNSTRLGHIEDSVHKEFFSRLISWFNLFCFF